MAALLFSLGCARFAADGWQMYTAGRERTFRALAAPGSTSIVTVDDPRRGRSDPTQSDGEIQAHLSALLVAEGWRRRGLAREADSLQALPGS